MNNKLLILVTTVSMLCLAVKTSAQAPVLGTSASFALFTTTGAVSNVGLSHLTGNVGTNNGSITGFGNVDGVIHNGNAVTALAAADLTIAYNQLNAAVPNFFPSPLLGSGQSLNAGTYFIGESASLTGTLTLNGQGNPNAVFIFQVQGSFSSAAASEVVLTNGALACNVFWKIEGLVDLSSDTSIKGTIVANNAAIVLNTGVKVEGRALSTTGAVSVTGATVTMPLGCGTPQLTGPVAPILNSVVCYTIFSGNGDVANTGVTFVTGDIGTNVGLTTGFQPENVNGTIHPNPDVSTAQCAADLNNVYTYLNTLPVDIELMFPAAFGQNLVLTPHTYLMNAATVLTGTVKLNAQGNPDAVFVIKINGALSTGTYATVELINGAQAKNVFWKIDGATSLNDYTDFKGTVIGNNGAVIINLGTQIEGRVLSTTGAVSTFGITAVMTPGCVDLSNSTNTISEPMAQFYPNPFNDSINVSLNNFIGQSVELSIYNSLGVLVVKTMLSQNNTNIQTNLTSGMYYYQLKGNDGSTQTGKLISK